MPKIFLEKLFLPKFFAMKYLLFPWAVIYGWLTDLRNYLYSKGVLKSVAFDVPTIVVGNLRIGGTGKTPFIEYLISMLAYKYQVATLSRGYGRKTRGFRVATPTSTAQEIGDEPLQLYQKFASLVKVCVGEKRVSAISQILTKYPQTQVILLDDAFQHRNLQPYLQILLTDYTNPFYKDYLLPMGRLREKRRNASRADLIIVTKCPTSITLQEKQKITEQVHRYAPEKKVLFTSIAYKVPRNIFTNQPLENVQQVALLSGIAQPLYFQKDMQERFQVVEHFVFPDHHRYNTDDVASIRNFLQKNPTVVLLCTEKDAVKLQKFTFEAPLQERIFCVGIEMRFVTSADKEFFESFLQEKLTAKL